MTSGWIILARSNPDSDTIGVFVIPPGTRTLTVTPVPSRSFAMQCASSFERSEYDDFHEKRSLLFGRTFGRRIRARATTGSA